MVNQINGCLWCWRVALPWPLQMHSLICHIFLSTLQFDKQDLNWSLPHSQQSTVSCKWLREIFTTLCVGHLMQSETAAATSLLLLLPPPQKCHGRWTTLSPFVWKLALTASGDWAQTRKSVWPLWFTWTCKLLLPSPDSGRSGGWGRGAAREEAGGWAERRCGCSSAGPGGKVLLVTTLCRLFNDGS